MCVCCDRETSSAAPIKSEVEAAVFSAANVAEDFNTIYDRIVGRVGPELAPVLARDLVIGVLA